MDRDGNGVTRSDRWNHRRSLLGVPGPWVLALGLVLALCAQPAPVAAGLIVGVVPQQSPAELARRWGPLLTRLGELTGLEFVFETAPSIPVFEERLAAGRYDFAYMNPYHYVVFHDKGEYQALAREKGVRIRGILVVPRESTIQDVAELKGKRVAFPAPAAFAATILPLATLKSLGIEVTPAFVSSHDSVYLGVARHYFEAGGGIERTFQSMEPGIRDALRILWTTPPYTPHAMACHQRVSEQDRAAFVSGLERLGQTPEGQEILAKANFKGFEPARDEDWNDIRALGSVNPDIVRWQREPVAP